MRLAVLVAACAAAYAQPLWFEPNQGQAHSDIQFQSHNVVLYATGATIRAGSHSLTLALEHANPRVRAEGLDRLPSLSNYYFGKDPAGWHTDVPHYARVRFRNVYPDIDLVYYGNAAGQLEYDFVAQPGADLRQISLLFNTPVHKEPNGDLFLAGIRQRRPKVYQNGHEINCDYIVKRRRRVELAVAGYDRNAPLTIDPVVDYATYLGGNGFDVASAVTVDATGAAYITGYLQSPNYPSLDPFHQASGLGQDIFVAKFTASGNGLAWYTYVGGSALDSGDAITLDASGNVYVSGWTASADFPVKGAAQPVFGGGYENAVIFKLSPAGKLIYSTYLGGDNQERGLGIAVDSTGAAFVSGFSYSIDFPVKNALQPTMTGRPDAFLAKLSPAGDQFLFATYLGGQGSDYGAGLALDPAGNPIIVGSTGSVDFPVKNAMQGSLGGSGAYPTNGFISKVASAGDRILTSTFLGQTGNGGLSAIVTDPAGNVFVAGNAWSSGWPLKNPIQSVYGGPDLDVFVAKLSSDLASVIYATYLGGSDRDLIGNIALDSAGNAYVTGFTYSNDFPLKNSLQPFIGATAGYKTDAFVVKIAPAGSLVYSTLVGGHGDDRGTGIAVDSQGKAYITGLTTSEDFPVKNGLQSAYGGGPGDIFLVRFAADVLPNSPFTVSPATLLFRYLIGSSPPAPQTVVVGSTSGVTALSAVSNASWLKFTSTSTNTPATLTVTADPSGLGPGTYHGAVQIDAQTGVQVNFTVLAPGPVVTGISPAVIALGSEATTITLSGTGFQPGATVELSGVTALATKFVDTGTLQITLDKPSLSQPVTLSFVVVNPNSAPSNQVTLTIGTPAPAFAAAGVVNAASYVGGSVAPGEIITIFGTNLTSSVTFDGTPATLIFSSPTQVNVTVPYSVTGPMTQLQIGGASVQLPVAPAAPGIFAVVPAGNNILTLYATGCGALTNEDLPRCALHVSVAVNDQPATVLYAGIALGLVQGANQINIQLPDGVNGGQLRIVLTAGDASSKPFAWSQP